MSLKYLIVVLLFALTICDAFVIDLNQTVTRAGITKYILYYHKLHSIITILHTRQI